MVTLFLTLGGMVATCTIACEKYAEQFLSVTKTRLLLICSPVSCSDLIESIASTLILAFCVTPRLSASEKHGGFEECLCRCQRDDVFLRLLLNKHVN